MTTRVTLGLLASAAMVATISAPALATTEPAPEELIPVDIIEGLEWSLSRHANDGLFVEVPDQVIVTLRLEGGTATGSGGCNDYVAGYERDGDTLVFGEIVSTEMYCLDGSETEVRYFANLAAVTGAFSTGGSLVMAGADGEPILEFLPATSALVPTGGIEDPTWQNRSLRSELPGAEAVSAGHGRYVAVGTDSAFPQRPVAWTSTDGITWDPSSIADAGPGSHMVAVTPTSDGFVALGHARDVDGAESNRILAWSSSDGMAWEPATVRRPARRGFAAIVAGLADGPAGQLALGSFTGQDLAGQRLWHAADGQTWEPAALPEVKGTAIWYTVDAVPDGYVLLGQHGPRSGASSGWKPSNWHSTDGVTWQRLSGSPRLTDLTLAPDGTVVGIGGQDVWRSSDLVEWEKVWSAPTEWALDGGPAFEWVRWASDRFMVTGYDHGACAPQTDECLRFPLLESADGRIWSQVNGPDGSFGIDSDTWLEDVASDGASTVLLSIAGAGPAIAWLMEDQNVGTGVSE